MKVSVETIFRAENKEISAFTFVIDKREVDNILKRSGLAAANKAIDGVVAKFVDQFKRKLAESLNK